VTPYEKRPMLDISGDESQDSSLDDPGIIGMQSDYSISKSEEGKEESGSDMSILDY
jgi:hypothetical protein